MTANFTTFTGRNICVTDLHAEEICIEDIAHSLCGLPRFLNHTREPYTVGDHSLWMMDLVPDDLKLHTLLHDAHEAYTGDMPSPLKAWLRRATTAWDLLEARIDAAIYQRFELRLLTAEEKAIIKKADLEALAIERRSLMHADTDLWPVIAGIDVEGYYEVYPEYNTAALEQKFRSAFWDLYHGV